MSAELVIAIISLAGTLLIGYSTLRRNKAGTFESYEKALGESRKNYEDLTADFEEFKLKFTELERKYRESEIWNRALVEQICTQTELTPISLETALAQAQTYYPKRGGTK